MMTIAQLAYQQPHKPKKDECQSIVKGLYEATDDMPTKNALAKLYTYFMPSAPKTPKTPFQWVAQAVADDGARLYLNHVYTAGDGVMVATSGQVLHYTTALESMAAGFYHPISGEHVKLNDCYTFPEWRRVLPPDMQGLAPLNVDEFKVREVGKYKPRLCVDIEGLAFDIQQVRQAIVMMKDPQYKLFGFVTSNLFISDGVFHAIICNIREDK